jgi:hypothetical protein
MLSLLGGLERKEFVSVENTHRKRGRTEMRIRRPVSGTLYGISDICQRVEGLKYTKNLVSAVGRQGGRETTLSDQ